VYLEGEEVQERKSPVQAKTPIVQRAARHTPWGAAHMRLEKKEIFVGLNGINIGKENGLRAGLYNSPNSSGGQRRKSMEWRNYSRRYPNCTLFLLIAGMVLSTPTYLFMPNYHFPLHTCLTLSSDCIVTTSLCCIPAKYQWPRRMLFVRFSLCWECCMLPKYFHSIN
jgi:hypothetical protein